MLEYQNQVAAAQRSSGITEIQRPTALEEKEKSETCLRLEREASLEMMQGQGQLIEPGGIGGKAAAATATNEGGGQGVGEDVGQDDAGGSAKEEEWLTTGSEYLKKRVRRWVRKDDADDPLCDEMVLLDGSIKGWLPAGQTNIATNFQFFCRIQILQGEGQTSSCIFGIGNYYSCP